MQFQLEYTFRHNLHNQILKICHSLELPIHKNHLGPKIFSEYQKLTLIILWKRSKKSLRRFVSTLPEYRWAQWLNLRALPSKSVLHNWLKEIPEKIIRMINGILLQNQKPSLMAVDATGIDSWKRSRHYERRIGSPYMPYAKLDLLVDTDSLLIYDHVLRIQPRHDVIGATTIFQRMKLKNVKILGDKGYDCEELHKMAKSKGNKLYAPVRIWPGAVTSGFLRKKCLIEDEDYPKRNSVESINHSLKSVWVDSLKCKKGFLKKREIAWHIVIYNMEKLIEVVKAWLYHFWGSFWTRPVTVMDKSQFPRHPD